MKEHTTIEDMATLLRIGKIYRQVNPKISLACVLVTGSIDPKVMMTAERCRVKILKV